ncbi:MAG TPA: DUF1045 domain-containing protein [Paracoccaceae bacterium]|nr:DUF1045 domain-containing protein [Paracoccaceae bacterium]
MKCERYAIWWVPRPGTELAQFGVEWTGWCADRGVAHARRALSALSRSRAGVPGAARLRGLHATVTAPFRLAPGRSVWGLETALTDLAGRMRPIRLPRLRVEVCEGRVVLAPSRPDEAVMQLLTGGAEAVRPFRVTPEYAALSGPGAVAAGGLVLPDLPQAPGDQATRAPVRFRLPLSDRIEGATAMAAELDPVLAPLLAERPILADLALVGDLGRGRPWRLLERFALEAEAQERDAPPPSGMDCRGPTLLAPSLA